MESITYVLSMRVRGSIPSLATTSKPPLPAPLPKAAGPALNDSLILVVALAAANLHAEILVFEFVSGVMVRAIQVFLKKSTARIVAVVASFGMFGIVSGCLQPPGSSERSSA